MTEYRIGTLRFKPADGSLGQHGAVDALRLRPQLVRLLSHLIEHAGEVVPREQLYQAVWGDDRVVDFESGLAALLRELRQAFRQAGEDADRIETVPRRGYRLNVTPDGARPRRHPPRWLVAALVLAFLAILIVLARGWYSGLAEPQSGPGPEGDSLAILPFAIYADGAHFPEHIDLLLADYLLAELLENPPDHLALIGRTGLRAYLDRSDLAVAIAADLGVTHLIEGSVMSDAHGAWRVEIRLLRMPQAQVVWSSVVSENEIDRFNVAAIADQFAQEFRSDWLKRLTPQAAPDGRNLRF